MNNIQFIKFVGDQQKQGLDFVKEYNIAYLGY